MKVIFFGSSRYIIPVLEGLHTNFDLPLVITTEQGSMEPVPFFCKVHKIDFLSVRKSADLTSSFEIESLGADVGVVADFGIIIPKKILDMFPMGVLNIHPSLLPKYRGPTPVQNAILNSETETGVTIIKLDKYMDHGPVVAQVKEEIKSTDTAKSLYERLFRIGASLLQKTLSKFQDQKIVFIPQNHEHATFTQTLKRDDGFIDFKNFFSGKEFIDRIIRAYYPWPGVWTQVSLNYKEKEKIVKLLPDKKIQVEGGKEMSYKDFINGYPNADQSLMAFLRKDI